MRRILTGIILLFLSLTAAIAQRKVSADVEVSTVKDGKAVKVTKSVYCSRNGRLVTYFKTPQEYYLVTNALGEARSYSPVTKEAISLTGEDLSSRDDLLSVFMSGRVDDLGLTVAGYRLSSTEREGNLIKKTFVPTKPGGASKVLLVMENYLPIYCAYYNASGKIVNKTYYSGYKTFPRMVLPLKVIGISFDTAKDSIVTRSVYSNVKVDVDDPLFDYEIPADATPVAVPVLK